ncbi:MAG TPA: 16S rRNA (cytidine(1402)-2'-O)-methyltransferase [Candidatus Pygmaiobacter gallistercoris]|nr:16S rRNA (cytidine(1402)-2'-O)-methyltransferase [Candidatus Pygmaiobacter gallistercoris]
MTAQGSEEKTGCGTLYVVATPIGNLGDLTPRAAETFAAADFVAAEDTRVTLRLLNHLGLKKPMISYYEHNLRQRGEQILRRIEAGESCALCSDAGMPAISDPGELLVTDALARGIRVVPVPAASAAVTALAVSGQPTGRFCFEGFLPMNRRQRRERLEETRTERRTLIFYEAPHKLTSTLADLLEAFGDRSVTLCRELTKLHEQIWKTTLSAALAHYTENTPKGEFVLVVAGASAPAERSWTLEEAVALARRLADEGAPATAACRQAAAESGFAKSEIYRQLTAEKEG